MEQTVLTDQPITKIVWDEKYRHKLPDGSSQENSRLDSYTRVVKGVFAKDDKREGLRALRAMEKGHWVPAGRIHAGAGTEKRVTWINCYVSPDIEDSMETEKGGNSAGIMDALKVAALTQQMGGGIGMDFSTLRPRGAIVGRTGSISSGPLHFMDMWHSMCSTVMSSGSRRGAMMGTMRIDHPDVLEFIEAKHKKGRLTNFNVSILVTDAFMEALQADRLWSLGFPIPRADGNHVDEVMKNGEPWYIYQRLPAKELWDKIIRSTYEFAEPGIIFVDRINRENNLSYCEYIHCTNPCGEQPLPPNGDCNLGAVNLATLVQRPFYHDATVDWDGLDEAVQVGVRFLDNVLDNTIFPTKDQAEEARNKRRIGLGITGLGNMLQQLKIRYGSPESVKIAEAVMSRIAETAYRTSALLAKERGPFPAYNENAFIDAPFVRRLPKDVQTLIMKHGIRNGVLLTIAPTGTTSLYVGNVSSGCEPTFGWQYFRKMLKPDGSMEEIKVEDYGYRLYKEIVLKGEEPQTLPDYMVTALEINVSDHLAIQAALQHHVDASISKTINCPKDMPFEEFLGVYQKAYDLGLKGCTTYRPSDVRGSVLSLTSEKEKAKPSTLRKRESVLEGCTYKIKWPAIDHAFYVVINDTTDEEGRRLPFEIFINSMSVQHQEWITALTRTISAVFRRGGDITFLPSELEQVHSSDGGAFLNGKYTHSLVALIGQTITTHYKRIGLIPNGEPTHATLPTPVIGRLCPKCESPTLTRQEGCDKCAACGYSSCG